MLLLGVCTKAKQPNQTMNVIGTRLVGFVDTLSMHLYLGTPCSFFSLEYILKTARQGGTAQPKLRAHIWNNISRLSKYYCDVFAPICSFLHPLQEFYTFPPLQYILITAHQCRSAEPDDKRTWNEIGTSLGYFQDALKYVCANVGSLNRFLRVSFITGYLNVWYIDLVSCGILT